MTASTKVFGVVGHPLGQSKGVYVHNALFKTRGLNSVYCKFPVKNLNRFMARVAPFLQGFSVTLPHKTAIMRFLDGVDPAARAIGAVNTVMRRSKKLFGTNTDAPGALDAIEKRMHVRGKTVLIIGAGGAAKAIAFEAQRRGATIVIANRTVFKARRLARSLGASYVALNNIGGCDVLVNATSVGMIPHVSDTPVPRKSIRAEVVFDAVYNPPRTRLLRDAEAKGAAIIPGTEMYLNQGVRQAKLFTGKDPDVGLMRKILKERLG